MRRRMEHEEEDEGESGGGANEGDDAVELKGSELSLLASQFV